MWARRHPVAEARSGDPQRQKQGPAHLLPNERGLVNGTANPVWEHLG